MRTHALVLAAIISTALLVTSPAAQASPRSHHNQRHHSWTSRSVDSGDRGDQYDDGEPDTVAPSTDTTPDQASGAVLSGTAQTVNIQLTGYGAPDNTPAGSKTISMPVIHSQAGGTCTFADPVTFASPGSAGSTEFPKGQRVYFPKLRCYGISEDSGATAESVKHIDIYTGDGPKSVTDQCESDLTGATSAIVNPPANEPVTAGPLSSSSGNCRVG
jgi:hypothetical protein